MSRRIFISYRFSDRRLAHSVPDFFQANGGKCQGTAVYVDGKIEGGDDVIDAEIRRVMDTCMAVLFVVGDNNHNSPWINREVQLAISKDLPIAAVQLKGTTGGLPEELTKLRKPIEPLKWNSEILCQALNAIRQSGATR